MSDAARGHPQGQGGSGGDPRALTDGPGAEGVVVELVDVFILLGQGLEGVFILVQRAVLQGLGHRGAGSAPLQRPGDPRAHPPWAVTATPPQRRHPARGDPPPLIPAP